MAEIEAMDLSVLLDVINPALDEERALLDAMVSAIKSEAPKFRNHKSGVTGLISMVTVNNYELLDKKAMAVLFALALVRLAEIQND